MKAIVIEKYGEIEQLVAKEVSTPENPDGHDVLVKLAPPASGS
jgi:NADPH:quinone reductase-like Zn-dependent oxidoreductase